MGQRYKRRISRKRKELKKEKYNEGMNRYTYFKLYLLSRHRNTQIPVDRTRIAKVELRYKSDISHL